MVESQFQISIPSDTARGHEVQEKILLLLEHFSYSPKDQFGVKLALEEAIVNAIKHGNGLDPEKQVHISCDVSADRMRVIIEDEGEGFDPNDVPDPTDFENLDKPSGRGLMLIRAFMSHVEYNERGNRVVMEKTRTPAEE